MEATAHRWTSSPSASRRRSERGLRRILRAAALGLLPPLTALAGCGGGAGAACTVDGDCTGGLQCRGGVCLPLAADAGDIAPPVDVPGDDAAADEVSAEAEALDGAGDAPPETLDDGGADDVPTPPLATLAPGATYDPPDPGSSGVLGAAGESYALLLWENSLGIWDHYALTLYVDNGLKSAAAKVELGGPPRPPVTPCLPGRFTDPKALRLPDARVPVWPDPLPGDTTTFRVINPGGASMGVIDAELAYVGPLLEIWLDRTNDFTDPGDAVWAGVAQRFQDIVLPRERSLFHAEPDVDGNGHVTVLVTPTVAALGAAGYTNPYDLTTSSYGNHKDMIYLNPPGDWGGADHQVLSLVAVLAHELQHLIRAGALGVDVAESIYFNEGMSHLAADLAGYGFDNLWFLGDFLADPHLFSVPRSIDSPRMAASTDYTQDVVLRSSAFLLLRYLFDRLGGATYAADGTIADAGGLTLLRDQYVTTRRGIAELEWSTGASRHDFIPDWLTALLLDGRTDAAGTPLDLPARYRFGDPYADPVTGNQHGVALNANNDYPGFGGVFLPDVATTDLRDFAGSIDAGGIALLMVRPVVSGPVTIRLDAAAGADLGVRWVRLR